MRFKIDWASLIVGRKFTVLALFYFVFKGNFPSTTPRGGGANMWRGDLTRRVFCYRNGGLILGGAYFQNLTVTCQNSLNVPGNILRKLTFKCHSGSSILVWH